jgi:hypothetical protein
MRTLLTDLINTRNNNKVTFTVCNLPGCTDKFTLLSRRQFVSPPCCVLASDGLQAGQRIV